MAATAEPLPLLERLEPPDATQPLPRLVLPFDLRARSRLRARLDDGREVGLLLPRGTVLRGETIVSGAGIRARVVAADEDLIEVRAGDARHLARAAYHLGNRHVPVEVSEGVLRLQYDSVLVDMLIGLGATVRRAWLPFEPEHGAYGGGHGHGH